MTSELGLSDRLRRPRRLTVPRFTLSAELKQAVEAVQRRWPDVATLATEKDRERLLRKLTEHAALDDWRGIKGSVPGSGVGTGAHLLLHSRCRSFTVRRSSLPRRYRCTRPSAFPPACSGARRPTRHFAPA